MANFGRTMSVFGAGHFRFPSSCVMTTLSDASLPRRGNGKHRAHRQRFFNFYLSKEEVPEISVIQRSKADRFRRVYDAASSDSQ